MTLSFRLAVLAIHVVEFMFFAGILGCATAIIFSWVSIVKDVVSKDEDY
ncbi:MAG: hypothetical protein WDM87_06605 [Terracidiphilus sp.]